MTLADLCREALAGLRLRPTRSLLSALGFAVGAGAAVALAAVAAGARAEILARFDALGLGLVRVRAMATARRADPPPLTLGDAAAIGESFPFVERASPVRVVGQRVRLEDERIAVRVVGTDGALFALRGDAFRRGRAFGIEDAARGAPVCVLGAEAARHLGLGGDVYGALVNVGGNWYRVIGVLEASSPGLSIGGESSGRELYLPLADTLRGDLGSRQPVQEIFLQIRAEVEPEAAASAVRRLLSRRHGGSQPFEVKTAAALLREQRAARGVLDSLLQIVAVVALAVGGLGSFALAWQGALERRREIAIRRALGARRREIAGQFVLEGASLAVLGGVGGAAVAALASGLVAYAAGWPWLLEARAVALALVLPLAVALIATLVPALAAARIDPVAALRSEE